MTARNEHTCKLITTAVMPTTDAYRKGWDRIFGPKPGHGSVSVDEPTPYRHFDCPECGYRVNERIRDRARSDYACPRCGVYNLSHFKPWSRPVPTKERGSYYPPPDPIRVFILSMLGALAFVLLWTWTNAP